MTSSHPFPARSLPLLAPLTALLLTACGDGGAKNAGNGDPQAADAADGPAPMCASRDTTALYVAVLDYITTADPRPQRFLSAFGTDSALPEDGFKALQDKGPTYYYNDNPKNQAQVRAKLEQAGPYTTMLVVYKGRQDTDAGNAVTVSVGGHYVGGEHEGKVAPVRDITVRCDSTGWRRPSSAATPAAKPATAKPGA
jgi:hypothetical protein